MRVIYFSLMMAAFFSTNVYCLDRGIYFGKENLDFRLSKLVGRNYDRKIYIDLESKKSDVLKRKFDNYNVETLPSELEAQDNEIVYVGISNYGVAESAGKKWLHHNAYCIFLDRKTGALLYQAEPQKCLGEWVDSLHWKDSLGVVIDFTEVDRSFWYGEIKK